MTTRTDSVTTVRVEASAGRATPPPTERRFRETLRDGAGVLLDGVEGATAAIPGGSVVTAAVRGAVGGAGGGGSLDAGGAGAGDGGIEDMLSRQADSQLYYLELQQRIQDENRTFTTLSNVLKARHETAKTAIGNIR